jgi:hypothetical protein
MKKLLVSRYSKIWAVFSNEDSFMSTFLNKPKDKPNYVTIIVRDRRVDKGASIRLDAAALRDLIDILETNLEGME